MVKNSVINVLNNNNRLSGEIVSRYCHNTLSFRIGELFCGAGGISLGAQMAQSPGVSFDHIWATDIDQDSCQTYKNNISCKKIVCKDIRKLDFETLEKIGSVNALCFGFPCNDFSVVGKQAGVNGAYGSLYKYCVEAVKHFSPQWFLAENVGGIRNADAGKSLSDILKQFQNVGYEIFPHFYSFNNYGVPQRRQRIIIVGIRADQKINFKIPSPAPYKNFNNSAGWALAEIEENAPNHEFTNQSKIVIERLKHIKPGENAFTANLPPELKLNIRGAKISQIYRRLDENSPAYTITGSGGGGTHVYHWSENRALTNRERARLQSFPDDFVFAGNKESVRKQIGMAVSPQAVKVIFEAMAKSFLGVDYPSVPSNLGKLLF